MNHYLQHSSYIALNRETSTHSSGGFSITLILISYTYFYSCDIQLFLFFFLYWTRYIICFRCLSCRHISFRCLYISFLFSLYTLMIRSSFTLLFKAFFSLSLRFLFTFFKDSLIYLCILQLICTLNSKILIASGSAPLIQPRLLHYWYQRMEPV